MEEPREKDIKIRIGGHGKKRQGMEQGYRFSLLWDTGVAATARWSELLLDIPAKANVSTPSWGIHEKHWMRDSPACEHDDAG